MEKYPISVVCITHNAEGRIRKLVENCRPWVKEIIIVDQSSTDDTFKDADELADLAIKVTKKGTADPDRDWAFSLVSNPYILYLDDDETLPEETWQGIKVFFELNADICCFKFKNLVNGVDMKKILGDDPHYRLFKKNSIQWPTQIHQHPQINQNATIYYPNAYVLHERDFDKMVRSNRARNVIADDKMIALQERFIAAVTEELKNAV